MATSTTNLGLKKPAYSEVADIADINNNMDILDAKIGAVDNTSLQSQITTVNGNLNGMKNMYISITTGTAGSVILTLANNTRAHIDIFSSYGACCGMMIVQCNGIGNVSGRDDLGANLAVDRSVNNQLKITVSQDTYVQANIIVYAGSVTV